MNSFVVVCVCGYLFVLVAFNLVLLMCYSGMLLLGLFLLLVCVVVGLRLVCCGSCGCCCLDLFVAVCWCLVVLFVVDLRLACCCLVLFVVFVVCGVCL